MPRPKVKSDAITVRLSLAAYAEAERRAAKKGLTVRVWAEQAMEKALTPPSSPTS